MLNFSYKSNKNGVLVLKSLIASSFSESFIFGYSEFYFFLQHRPQQLVKKLKIFDH